MEMRRSALQIKWQNVLHEMYYIQGNQTICLTSGKRVAWEVLHSGKWEEPALQVAKCVAWDVVHLWKWDDLPCKVAKRVTWDVLHLGKWDDLPCKVAKRVAWEVLHSGKWEVPALQVAKRVAWDVPHSGKRCRGASHFRQLVKRSIDTDVYEHTNGKYHALLLHNHTSLFSIIHGLYDGEWAEVYGQHILWVKFVMYFAKLLITNIYYKIKLLNECY